MGIVTMRTVATRWSATLAAALLAGTTFAQPTPSPAAPPATAPPMPAPAVTPLGGGPTFISPMGEPFHSSGGISGAEQWFRATDADHDGRITLPEMERDADRFFALLDVNHDGEIGPDEIERYETEIAPEIRVMSTYGDPTLAKTDDDGKVTDPPYPDRLGAGRFGFLDMPEPVVSADANMDRAISKQEFEFAARRRFIMLDTDGNGALTRDELPKLDARAARRRGGRGGGEHGGPDGGGFHHGGGGMQGGGMGGASGMEGDGPGG